MSLRAGLRAALKTYERVNLSHPLPTRTLAGTLIYGAGDYAAQRGQHWWARREAAGRGEAEESADGEFGIDSRRMATISSWRALVFSPLALAFYAVIDTRITKGSHARITFTKWAIDMTGWSWFITGAFFSYMATANCWIDGRRNYAQSVRENLEQKLLPAIGWQYL